MIPRGERPRRLNLAVARRCFVACRGCYQFFGHSEPDLKTLLSSVARFVRLGVSAATLSGGDPLTLAGLEGFLEDLRSVGVTDLKVDTTGTALLAPGPGASRCRVRHDRLAGLLARVDYLGLPLDGWSNESVCLFRSGRSMLYDETVALLAAIDECAGRRSVVINTIVHALNSRGLRAIHKDVCRHRSVAHWNLFQYTPTDQVPEHVNAEFAVDEPTFQLACAVAIGVARGFQPGRRFTVAARSVRSRLGQYLLINSDGDSCLPDGQGRTVPLGPVAGREEEVLAAREEVVCGLRVCPRVPRRAVPLG